MSDLDDLGGMTDEEKEYFNSGGEKSPEEKHSAESEQIESRPDNAEESSETAAIEGDQKSQDKKNDKKDTVSHGALHAEREKRKKAEQKEREAAIKIAQYEERLKLIEEQQRARQPQQQEQIPDYNTDPAAYLRWENAQLRANQEQMAGWMHKQEQNTQENLATQHIRQRGQADVSEFIKDTPDYGKAYDFVVNSRLTELQALGYSREQALHLAGQEEIQIIQRAAQDGANAAQRLYAAAQSRGYRKEGNGSSLDTLERGVSASKSISAGGANGNKGKLTLEQLAELPQAEFAKVRDSDWRKMWGA